jgi:hypothetical protein
MVEQMVMQAILLIIGMKENILDQHQLLLPLYKGELGMQRIPANDNAVSLCLAGFIAAAALTQDVCSAAPKSLQLFKGETVVMLQQVWKQLSAACICTEACTWGQLNAVRPTGKPPAYPDPRRLLKAPSARGPLN